MICYFDTSALVPLLVDEPGRVTATRLWQKADRRVASQLIYVEAAGALAQARRMGRLDDHEHHVALAALDDVYDKLYITEISEALVRRGAVLTHEFGLRGYDAVHCATAERLAVPEFVFVSGDKKLLYACEQLGMTTADTNAALG
jgi:predicted nucleic acid-binding protein